MTKSATKSANFVADTNH